MNSNVVRQIEADLANLLNSSNQTDHWTRNNTVPPNDHLNQAVLFFKPELTDVAGGVSVHRVLSLIFDTLAQFSVEIGSVRILGSEYLRRHNIMDQHYGVINNISRQGQSALSETALAVMKAEYQQTLSQHPTILGGHQFLERFPQFSPLALNTLSDNLGTKKLGGGAYCISLVLAGEVFLVLNPFHPFQLEHFTAPGRAIVVIEALTKTSWRILRRNLVGATDPAKALDGSIRKALLSQKLELGLSEVGPGTNGVHLSAGPLEGMVELQRFFSEPGNPPVDVSATAFGRLLLTKGIPSRIIEHLRLNPTTLEKGTQVPVFDLTEECDADQAAEILSFHLSDLEVTS